MLDATFRALSDPTRREILQLLKARDLPAGEIASRFDMAFASVSHHLQVLRDAGLVQSRRDGQFIIYSLDTTVFQDVLQHLLDLAGAPARRGSRTPRGRR